MKITIQITIDPDTHGGGVSRRDHQVGKEVVGVHHFDYSQDELVMIGREWISKILSPSDRQS